MCSNFLLLMKYIFVEDDISGDSNDFEIEDF